MAESLPYRPRERPDAKAAEANLATAAPDLGFIARPRVPEPPRRRWWPWSIAVVVVVILIATLVTVGRADRLRGVDPRLTVGGAGRLALLPWTNATGESSQAWVTAGLMEMIAQALAETPGMEVIPPLTVDDTLSRRRLDGGDAEAREGARAAVRSHGATAVLDVAVERRGDGYRLEASLYGDDGEVVHGTFEGPELMRLAERLGDAVVRGVVPDALRFELARTLSDSAFLNQLYAMGLSALRRSGPKAARRFFEIALESQPRFLLARARLAECDRQLGELAAAETAWLGLLDEAQQRGDRFLSAHSLAALAELAALEGRAREADELARQADAVYLALDSRVGRIGVLALRARLAQRSAEVGRAEALLVEIVGMQQALGDLVGQAATLRRLAELTLEAGDEASARETLELAQTLAREAGDIAAEMSAAAALGDVAAALGDPAAADAAWARALTYFRQQDDPPRVLQLAQRRAEAALVRGDLDVAEELYLDVESVASALGNAAGEGRAALALAEILLRKGYRFQARPHLDRALALDRAIDDPLAIQRVIARFAYERGDYELAVDTMRAVESKAGDGWSATDQALLDAYQRARGSGERRPLP